MKLWNFHIILKSLQIWFVSVGLIRLVGRSVVFFSLHFAVVFTAEYIEPAFQIEPDQTYHSAFSLFALVHEYKHQMSFYYCPMRSHIFIRLNYWDSLILQTMTDNCFLPVLSPTTIECCVRRVLLIWLPVKKVSVLTIAFHVSPMNFVCVPHDCCSCLLFGCLKICVFCVLAKHSNGCAI